MNDDFRDFLAALLATSVRFLIVGAHAMAAHGVPRATGDLDVWIETSQDNVDRVWDALIRFGAPTQSMGVTKEDLRAPDTVVQFGVPPTRIDVMTEITDVPFERAWASRSVHEVAGLQVPFIGRQELLQNKRATGRAKDLADLTLLERELD